MDGTIKNSKLIFYKTESSQNLVELINIKIQKITKPFKYFYAEAYGWSTYGHYKE